MRPLNKQALGIATILALASTTAHSAGYDPIHIPSSGKARDLYMLNDPKEKLLAQVTARDEERLRLAEEKRQKRARKRTANNAI